VMYRMERGLYTAASQRMTPRPEAEVARTGRKLSHLLSSHLSAKNELCNFKANHGTIYKPLCTHPKQTKTGHEADKLYDVVCSSTSSYETKNGPSVFCIDFCSSRSLLRKFRTLISPLQSSSSTHRCQVEVKRQSLPTPSHGEEVFIQKESTRFTQLKRANSLLTRICKVQNMNATHQDAPQAPNVYWSAYISSRIILPRYTGG
jgi:hypothetical protein